MALKGDRVAPNPLTSPRPTSVVGPRVHNPGDTGEQVRLDDDGLASTANRRNCAQAGRPSGTSGKRLNTAETAHPAYSSRMERTCRPHSAAALALPKNVRTLNQHHCAVRLGLQILGGNAYLGQQFWKGNPSVPKAKHMRSPSRTARTAHCMGKLVRSTGAREGLCALPRPQTHMYACL